MEINLKYRFLIVLLFLLGAPFMTRAQKVSLGTDAIQWANFGTVNIDLGVSVHQHLSFSAGGRFNPWEFGRNNVKVHYHQKGAYLGCRYWPWYVFSGWWFGAKVQYMDYSRTGIWRPALEEGKRLGAGFSFGYTVMLSEKINLEFGAGSWGGYELDYALYECPVCMDLRDSGARGFIDIDNVSVSIFYVF